MLNRTAVCQEILAYYKFEFKLNVASSNQIILSLRSCENAAVNPVDSPVLQ